MKIVVVGTRGIPNVQGGVETHCEQLYPRLAALGHDITLMTRSPYIAPKDRRDQYRGVRLQHLYTPRRKSLEAIVHTTLAILHARRQGADIVHIHAIGPALLTPLARLLGMRTVVTHHGPDYERQKWGRLARAMLRLGERAAACHADALIVISRHIAERVAEHHGRTDTHLIPNGVNLPVRRTETDRIEALGLRPGRYVIAVGRFVEEKGFHDLVTAWQRLPPSDCRLVLVGDADHETRYSHHLKQSARDAGVILTGFIKGEDLAQVYSHARLFVMPSYHEGLPIALLEAMSYGLPVLVSDIPANLEVPLEGECYFPVGDVRVLTDALDTCLAHETHVDHTALLKSHYDWGRVAEATSQVYAAAGKRQP